MAAEMRDMHCIQFGSWFGDHPDRASRRRHFAWFKAHGLRWETAAPRGWLEGDPGVYAVHFDGPDDPGVAEYAAKFEDETGRSRYPDAYQMYLLPYAVWLERRGTDAGEDGLDDDGEP